MLRKIIKITLCFLGGIFLTVFSGSLPLIRIPVGGFAGGLPILFSSVRGCGPMNSICREFNVGFFLIDIFVNSAIIYLLFNFIMRRKSLRKSG